MKKLFGLLLMLNSMALVIHAQNTKQQPGDLLRHVVLLKFKNGSTTAEIKKVEDAFRALPSKIEVIRGFEWGTNNSPEHLNQEFTHCFFVSFNTENDRDVYLPHSAHKAFVEVLTPHMDKVLVIDYWAKK